MRKALASLVILCASLIGASALAQSVQQSGSVTRGHIPAWATQGVVQDGGTSANPQVNAVAVYGSGGCPISITGTTTAGAPTGQYVQGCLSASNSGVQLSVTPFGGLGTQPFIINIGGDATYTIGGTNWLSTIFNQQFCSTVGSVLYRDSGGAWKCLGPGNSGQVLQTQGPGANPLWAAGGGTGSVTSITAGTGLSGGTITSSGTIALLNPVAVNLGGTGAATLTSHAVILGNGTTAVNVAAPGVAGTCLQSNGVSADPTFQSCPGTGTVTSISAGTGISVSPSPIVSSGTVTLAAPPNANLGAVQAPGGRLTLTTATPVMKADATAQTTIYYDTMFTNYVPIFSGSTWSYLVITADEVSMGLDSVTPHIALGSLYDVFGVSNAGSLAICAGPAWTNTTTRATAIARQNGIWTNSTSMTHCWGGASGTTDYGTVSANTGTYLGTFYATANGQTGVQFNPAAAAGGSATIVGLFNAYNRVPIDSKSRDSTASWTYQSATWRKADNNANNSVTYVDGLAVISPKFAYDVVIDAATQSGLAGAALNWASGAPNVAGFSGAANAPASTADGAQPALGLNVINAIEAAVSAVAATTFRGTAPTIGSQVQALVYSGEM